MIRDTQRNTKQSQRPYQIINDQAQFTDGLESFLQQNKDIQSWGADYNIISVIGGQSSGKSTLLNGLFGTSFDVLDSSQRRTQTTQGVWIQRDHTGRVLVLDMEGSDSTSRWDSTSFEKYITLFALTLSDHLLVNIWTTEVGRFQASQYAVLRIALELNIRLWNIEQTKSIFFVLRDYQEQENLSFIKQQIEADLLKIWTEIKKPPKLLNLALNQLFQLHILTLPNKIYEAQKFDTQVQQLRNLLVQRNKSNSRNAPKTPIDGLPLLAVAVWKIVTSQQDLNLPNTRKIVSQIRSDQIMTVSIQIVSQQVKQLNLEDPQQFKRQLLDLLEHQKTSFSLATENYEQEVISLKRQEFMQRMVEISQPQISILILNFMNQLQGILQSNLLQLARSKGDYNSSLSVLKQQVLTRFKSQVFDLKQFITDQGIQDTLKAYENSLCIYVDTFKEQLYDQFVKEEFQNHKQRIDSVVEVWNENLRLKLEFKNFDVDIIGQIMRKTQLQYQIIDNAFSKFRETFNLKNLQQDSAFLRQCQTCILDSINQQLQQINTHALNKFKDIFLRENGMLRSWKNLSQDQIFQLYLQSQKHVLISLSNLQINEQKSTNQIGISRTVHDKLSNQIKSESEREYEEALRKKSYDETNQISLLYWGILIFFVYDDIYAWCLHPLFQLLLICMGATIGALYITGFVGFLFVLGYGFVPKFLILQIQNIVMILVKFLVNKFKQAIR